MQIVKLLGGFAAAAAVALGAVGAAAAASAAEANPSANGPVRLDSGHMDVFNISSEGDAITLGIKEDATGSSVHRTPEDVVLVVKSQAVVRHLPTTALPAGAPGEELYYLPLTQDAELIWPGWDSLEAQGKFGSDLKADIEITKVDGPGTVYLWSQGAFGGVSPLLKDGKFALPGTIHQDSAAHVHANWAFTKAGTYHITAQAKVASADSKLSAETGAHVYTFEVQPAPTAVTVTAKRDAADATRVTLTATQAPAGAAFTKFVWQQRTNGGDWQPLTGNGATTTATVPSDASAEFRVTVSGGKDFAQVQNGQPISLTSEAVKVAATTPSEPQQPSEPVNPSTPAEPSTPAKPSEPASPSNPATTPSAAPSATPQQPVTPVPTATATAQPTTAQPSAAPQQPTLAHTGADGFATLAAASAATVLAAAGILVLRRTAARANRNAR